MTAGPSESSPDVVAVLLRAGPDEWRGVRALRLPLLAGAHVVVRPRSLATLCDDRPTAGSESATLEMRVQSPLVAQTRWPGGRRGLQVRVGENSKSAPDPAVASGRVPRRRRCRERPGQRGQVEDHEHQEARPHRPLQDELDLRRLDARELQIPSRVGDQLGARAGSAGVQELLPAQDHREGQCSRRGQKADRVGEKVPDREAPPERLARLGSARPFRAHPADLARSLTRRNPHDPFPT